MSLIFYFYIALLIVSVFIISNTRIKRLFCSSLFNFFLNIYRKSLVKLSDLFRFIILGEKTILKSPELGISTECAKNRREKITRFLIVSTKNDVFNEFLEIPPFYQNQVPLKRIKLNNSIGLRSNLKYQQKFDELLLLGRVMDAIKCIERIHKKDIFQKNENNFILKLEKNHNGNHNEQLFSWKVLIKTNYLPDLYIKELKKIQDWLGIGIDYKKSRRKIKFLGECHINNNAKKGLIGGNIHTSDDRIFQLTCNHVISSKCKACHLREEELDVAVLDMLNNGNNESLECIDNNCFIYPTPKDRLYTPVFITAAEDKVIRSFMEEGKFVQKVHPKTNKILGIVRPKYTMFARSDGSTSPLCLEVNSFSRIAILNFFYKMFDINFTKSGDSGSWVFGLNSTLWIGMVVAIEGRNSFIIPSKLLLNFVSDKLNIDIQQVSSWGINQNQTQ